MYNEFHRHSHRVQYCHQEYGIYLYCSSAFCADLLNKAGFTMFIQCWLPMTSITVKNTVPNVKKATNLFVTIKEAIETVKHAMKNPWNINARTFIIDICLHHHIGQNIRKTLQME